ncbi:zinc-ribbon domain-containing protein [Fusicatenibacter sp.]
MAEDFFGNLSKTLKKTVDTVGKKTDEFVEIQKIRTRQHALEDQIEKNYQDIGQIIYNRYLNGEAFDENLAGICKDITDLEKEIADCKEDVANKRGRIVCPACGASVPKDAAFCMRCGAAMPEKEEEPEDAEFVHVKPEEEGQEEVSEEEKTAEEVLNEEPEEKAEETETAAPEEEPEKEAEAPEEE